MIHKGKMQRYCYGGDSGERDYDQVVSEYIEYYHTKARRCKFGFHVFSLIKIMLIGIMPVLQAAGIVEDVPWTIAALSSGILVVESVIELWRLKEKWILYRSTCNRLMTLQRQHKGRSGKPDKEMEEYIAMVEAVINSEGDSWIELSKDKKKSKEK